MDNINIKGPEEYNLYFDTSREWNVWLDGKGKPIPLDQPLTNQACIISQYDLWNARCTRKSIHPKDTPPRQGGAYNSPAVDKDTPNFNTPLAPQWRLQSICPNHMGSALGTILSKISELTITFPLTYFKQPLT